MGQRTGPLINFTLASCHLLRSLHIPAHLNPSFEVLNRDLSLSSLPPSLSFSLSLSSLARSIPALCAGSVSVALSTAPSPFPHIPQPD
jgi:hypothetical protein